jgi:hypothetical protein
LHFPGRALTTHATAHAAKCCSSLVLSVCVLCGCLLRRVLCGELPKPSRTNAMSGNAGALCIRGLTTSCRRDVACFKRPGPCQLTACGRLASDGSSRNDAIIPCHLRKRLQRMGARKLAPAQRKERPKWRRAGSKLCCLRGSRGCPQSRRGRLEAVSAMRRARRSGAAKVGTTSRLCYRKTRTTKVLPRQLPKRASGRQSGLARKDSEPDGLPPRYSRGI